LMAAAYDGDGNRVFQLNYNLHTDEDWKDNSGNGNGNNKDNAGSGNNGNGNSSSGNNGNGNGSKKENSKSDGTDDAGYGNATNAEEHNSQNQSGILFPVAEEISHTETDLIAMIKTTGKEKDYELIEYILDVNTQYTQVLMELNENGAMDVAYTYGTARLTEDRFTGESNFYLYDPSGNVAGITDQNGYLWQPYRYDAFGNATFGSPQYDNEYTFNAESYNPNIHSQYLRARYYDTVKGCFLTEDSYLGDIRNPLTLNRYSYCIGNPLFYSDPSGHFPTDYEVTDTVREKLEEDFLNDTKNSLLDEYQRYELYEERKDAYKGLNYTGFWDAPWFSEEEQRISYMVDLDYGNPKHRRLIKLAAETARNMAKVEQCDRDREYIKSGLNVYLNNNYELTSKIEGIQLTEEMEVDIKNFKNIYKEEREKYNEIARETNVPPVLIAAIHYRESNNNFNYSIRNGQMPVASIEEFLSDAEEWFGKGMTEKGIRIPSDASIELMLTYAELHNGVTYAKEGLVNPYLYSGTNIYMKGKYVADKVYDGEKVDRQVGVYALIMAIDEKEWYLEEG
ncbi:MAG: hypothetical protein K2P64_08030, partial [Lachnospiraceae bacterium]|nr:hypothetical protein [Lachnospiraceae bacterium]